MKWNVENDLEAPAFTPLSEKDILLLSALHDPEYREKILAALYPGE